MDHIVRDTTTADLMWLAAFMREEDKKEVAAASGLTPAQTMIHGGQHSPFLKTVLVDDIPMLVFGVASHPSDKLVGTVWMLATDYLMAPRCRRVLRHHSRPWINKLQDDYPILTNIADKRNKAHLRWLKWCGFTFINEVYLGPSRAPFLEFVRIKNV